MCFLFLEYLVRFFGVDIYFGQSLIAWGGRFLFHIGRVGTQVSKFIHQTFTHILFYFYYLNLLNKNKKSHERNNGILVKKTTCQVRII